ncbi:MAG: hypothetical protein Q8M16_15120 [Pirellulaceae bacterium]|nr:hypothetical protein [Pirellulaceae bacterium]
METVTSLIALPSFLKAFGPQINDQKRFKQGPENVVQAGFGSSQAAGQDIGFGCSRSFRASQPAFDPGFSDEYRSLKKRPSLDAVAVQTGISLSLFVFLG